MKYWFKSLKQIIDIFDWDEKIGATEISNRLWKSRVIVHKYLKELVNQWILVKFWMWPTVEYQKKNSSILVTKDSDIWNQQIDISFQDRKLLDEIFLKFSPNGTIMKWLDGMKIWCQERWLYLEEKVKLYIDVYKHIRSLEDSCGIMDAKKAFWKDFEKVYLDNIFYADQYNRMEFWRWKLAELTFYAKSTQNKKLIEQSIDEIIYKLECKLKKEKYDAIAITPWSIERKNQLLKFLEMRLKSMWFPFVKLIKYYASGITIPQKSLKTRAQRIDNAKNTIFVYDEHIKKYNKVFLIDDFVWSGSTLNETAKKLKETWVKQVDWFAFVWNLNLSYEVINEV